MCSWLANQSHKHWKMWSGLFLQLLFTYAHHSERFPALAALFWLEMQVRRQCVDRSTVCIYVSTIAGSKRIVSHRSAERINSSAAHSQSGSKYYGIFAAMFAYRLTLWCSWGFIRSTCQYSGKNIIGLECVWELLFFILLLNVKGNIHPSIFYRLIRQSGRGGAEAYPSSLRAIGRVRPRQVASG